MEANTEPVKILLVDDHCLFRQSLHFMLDRQKDLSVIGEARDGEEAVAKAHELMPDVILMDLRMPKCDGLVALKRLGKELPGIHVVILTVSEDDDDLFSAIKSGAKGYLLKTSDAEELLQALRQVSKGGAVVSPSMAVRLLNEFAAMESDQPEETGPPIAELTGREKEILELLGQGMGNREIAVTLCVAESTVKSHLRNVMEKLHIHNRTQAAAYVVRQKMTAKARCKVKA